MRDIFVVYKIKKNIFPKKNNLLVNNTKVVLFKYAIKLNF